MLKKKYKSINELINALTSTDEVYRRNAIHNLVRIGEPAVLPLINSLKDENFFVRSQVIIALGMIGDYLAVEPLINSLKDDNAKVRENTVIALGNFSNARIVEPLVNLLKDENPQVRENTSRILHKIGRKPRSIKSAQSFNKKIEYGCEICSNSAEYILFLKSKKTIDMYYYLVCRVCNERIMGKEEEIGMFIKSENIVHGRNNKNSRSSEFITAIKKLINQCTEPNNFEVMILDSNHLFYKPIYDSDILNTFIPEMVASRQLDSFEYHVNILKEEFGNRYNIVLYKVDGDSNNNKTYHTIGKIHSFTIAECQKCRYPFSYRYEGGPLRKRCPECVDWTKLYKEEYQDHQEK